MKRFFITVTIIALIPLFSFILRPVSSPEVNAEDRTEEAVENSAKTIAGIVQAGETMDSIFGIHGLDKKELTQIYVSSKKFFNLGKIRAGSVYSFKLEKSSNKIQNMQFSISNDSFLNVVRESDGFSADTVTVDYEVRRGSFFIHIEDTLASSMPGTHREYKKIALQLSDIYAWDIDFSNDIQNGDTVKIIVEELWAGEAFKGYGDILAAEFTNSGKVSTAYRYEHDGYADYFDDSGRSLRKALLRSPLKFKYISSKFNRRRLHPVLGVNRPHLGVDYAAPTGTHVSAAGSGKIIFAGHNGRMGKMVKIQHPGGYITYYGHLSRIPREIRRGKKVSQGDLIGYVGATGMATGPHLDYRIKYRGKFVNPLTIQLPRGKAVPENLMADFNKVVNRFSPGLAALKRPVIARTNRKSSTSGS